MESTPSQLSDDLHYVRSAVERATLPAFTPPAIAFYWGLASLVGFSLCDFAPRYSGLFWLIAGPLGGVYSWLVGRSISKRLGQDMRGEGIREMWHWVGMGIAIVLLCFPAARGRIGGDVVGQIILLIVALTYFQAWVRRGDWVILVAAGFMVAGFIALNFVDRYAW